MKKFTVYCHISPSNKKYVGITSTNPQKRWDDGMGYKKNYHFFRAIQKYGWDNFKHIILYSDISEERAKEIERSLVKEWKLTEREFGYNLRDGGDGSFSEESIQKMSISRKGNKNSVGRVHSNATKKRISNSLKKFHVTHKNAFFGKHHTEETKEKLKQRIVSDETREKMRQNHHDVSGKKNPSARAVIAISPSGKIYKKYDYATLAAKELNADLSSIIKCCKGRQKTCAGFYWKYDDHCK